MRSFAISILLATTAACAPSSAERKQFPDPATDVALESNDTTSTAVFAGGCFWGTEAVFEHVKGVKDVISGFAGGTGSTDYQTVSSGQTKHAEAVRIVYDPTMISYGQLLKTFFSVAHDPTQLNRQGPDVGPQYRSAIFVANADEQRVVEAYMEQLTAAKIYRKPIVTEVAPLKTFHVADASHQDYAARHPNAPYILANDAPKIARLKRELPQLYRER